MTDKINPYNSVDKISVEFKKIAVIGLGYVGLPLAVEFGKKYKTVGFDIDSNRVHQLVDGKDVTLEVKEEDLIEVLHNKNLNLTDEVQNLRDCNVYIVAVPTPIDKNNKPDLVAIQKASQTIGGVLKKNDIIIYESTVYPGLTEDECAVILEKESGLIFNKDFFCGYSPERINPGDKNHTVTKIVKITSGSTLETAEVVDQLYNSIIEAGTYKAPSIKVAEAAKVIENSQRDINIAFVNELAKIFNKMGIDTKEVLEAASTKWNSLPFKPGLVGGHCIGVDPYYLAQKAQEMGYHPEIIVSGRRMNDSMGQYIGSEVLRLMIQEEVNVNNSNILILGITFKEDCPDIRNTRVIDIYHELKRYKTNIDIYDPFADKSTVKNAYGIELIEEINKEYDAIILAVSHQNFLNRNLRDFLKIKGIIYDVKSVLDKEMVDGRL